MLSIEKQVVGQPLSIALYRAGIRMQAQFYWVNDILITYSELLALKPQEKPYAAYTIAELGEIIPDQLLDGEFSFRIIKDKLKWISLYVGKSTDMTLYSVDSSELADSVGRVVLHLVKDGYLNVQGIAA